MLLESLDRLVEQARDSALQGKINPFDQQRMNGFLRLSTGTSKVSDRPDGYNQTGEGFLEAPVYTSKLSAFVKIAHLLIMQRAVVAAETSGTKYPAQMLEQLQDRFLVYGSRSPVNWAQKLRVYGKKIRDPTTSLGYIVWSDDTQHLSYKVIHFSMFGLKHFIRTQIFLSENQLRELLLIHTAETRELVDRLN